MTTPELPKVLSKHGFDEYLMEAIESLTFEQMKTRFFELSARFAEDDLSDEELAQFLAFGVEIAQEVVDGRP